MNLKDPQPGPIRFIHCTPIVAFVLVSAFVLAWQISLAHVDQSNVSFIPRPALLQQYVVQCKFPRFEVKALPPPPPPLRPLHCPFENSERIVAELDENGDLSLSLPFESDGDAKTKCGYRALDNDGDLFVELPIPSVTTVPHTVFAVECIEFGSTILRKHFTTFRNSQISQFEKSLEGVPSVAILVLDEVSNIFFARHLPKTIKFMAANDFLMPDRYVQSEPSSDENLRMLLEGQKENWDIIRLLNNRGCATMVNEEFLEADGNETVETKTDFSMKWAQRYYFKHRASDHCLVDGKSRSETVLESLVSFSEHHSNKCHLSFSRLRSPTGRTRLELGLADTSLRKTLDRFVNSRAGDNSILLVLSPSGSNGGEGLHGAMEKRSPLFAVWFPRSFRIKENYLFSTFAANMDKLFTTRDVHATLKTMVTGAYPERPLIVQPFDPIPEVSSLLDTLLTEYRSCESVGLIGDDCLCLSVDQKKNETLNSDPSMYIRAFAMAAAHSSQYPCIGKTSADDEEKHISVFRPNGAMRETVNTTEWITVTHYAEIRKELFNVYYSPQMETTLKHDVETDELSVVETFINTTRTFCRAVHAKDLCEYCFNHPITAGSPAGPAKGFLNNYFVRGLV